MKKLIFFGLFASFVLLFTACEKSKEELILGTWKIESITSSEEMDEVQKSMFDQTNADVIDNTTYTFKEGTVLLIKYGETESEWKWGLAEDGKSLSMQSAEAGEKNYVIKSMSATEMVLDDVITENNIITSVYKKQ